jgi:Glycosyltransferase family 87
MSARLDRAMLALIVALAAAGVIVIVSQPAASRLSADFTINYSAGVLIRQGHLAGPYRQAELGDVMRRLAPNGAIDPRLPFSLPLAAGLPYAALSLLPLDLAFRCWQLISFALLLGAVLVLQRGLPLPRGAPGLAMLGLLAAVPTWATLNEGQPTALLALGAAMVILALRVDSLALAAGAGMLLAVKPQYVPAYLAILLAARRWRSLSAASVGAAFLLLSPLAGGIGGLSAMVHNALSANQSVPVHLNEAWIGLFGPALPTAAATGVAVALYLVVLGALALVGWRHPGSGIGLAVLTGVLTVLASPHALPHDLVILAVPAWIAIVLFREDAIPNPVPGLILIDLAFLIDLHGVDLPIGPIALTGVVAWYGWQFRRRAGRRQRPPIGQAA